MLNKETLSISFCVHQKFCGNKYVVTEPDFSADSQTEPNIWSSLSPRPSFSLLMDVCCQDFEHIYSLSSGSQSVVLCVCGSNFLVPKFLFGENNKSTKTNGLNTLLFCSLKITYFLLTPLSFEESCQNSNTSKGFFSEGKLGQFWKFSSLSVNRYLLWD